MFNRVDTGNKGRIGIDQMQRVLINKNGKPFSFPLCFALVNMYDMTKTGTLDINEWAKLWDYLMFWKSKFDTVDRDGGGTISFTEFSNLILQNSPFKSIMNDQDIHNMCRLAFDRFDYSRFEQETFTKE